MRDELNRLAERVEALEGPSRKIDVTIALAKGWIEYAPCWFTPPGLTIKHHESELPRFTASLDAAMSLVGDNHWKAEDHPMAGPCAVVGDSEAFAATPALALTAAALRALAEQHP